MKSKPLFISLGTSISFAATAQAATLIQVSLETTGPVGLAPAIVGFSDGSFDIFDVGASASSALEDLAETGSPAGFSPPDGGAVFGPGVGPGSPPIFGPGGATASAIFTVDDGNSRFNLASMVLPSNDWFIGNADGLDVSALLGSAPGTTISFDFTSVWDAGTELEDFASAPGGGLIGITTPGNGDPGVGADQGGTISLVSGPDPFGAFANIEPGGFDSSAFDFTGAPVGSVRLTVVPEPSAIWMTAAAVLPFLVRRHRRLVG